MKLAQTLITALLLAPVLALAAEKPSLLPPKHIGPPLPEHAVTNRVFTGIPSMAVAPKGRLWATWYAGATGAEDLNNYVVLATSGDGGATWSEVLTIDPDGRGPVRSFDPELRGSPDGRLFALADGKTAETALLQCFTGFVISYDLTKGSKSKCHWAPRRCGINTPARRVPQSRQKSSVLLR